MSAKIFPFYNCRRDSSSSLNEFKFRPVASVTLAVNLRLAFEALGTIDRLSQ